MDITRKTDPESSISVGKVTESWSGIRAFKTTLRFKLLLIVVGVSLVSVLGSTFLFINHQRRQLIESAEMSATSLSNTIEANLHHAMLTDDRAMINEIIQSVVVENSVDALSIMDDQGFVSASSTSSEVGTRLFQEQVPCQNCHSGSALPKNNIISFKENKKREVLINVNPIENHPECQICHSPENRILGLMMIETPLTLVNEQIKTGIWRTTLITLAAHILLIGLVVTALNRHVVDPLEELSKGVSEISSGNLNYRVPVVNKDELGELAAAFDHMRGQLQISRAEMERREHELSILNEVGLAATQLLDLQEILDFTLDIMVNKLGMAVGMIYLLDEVTGRYTLHASHGLSPAQTEEIERRRRSGWDITQEVIETGKEVFVANMATDARFTGLWEDMQGRSFAKLPMMSRGTIVGVLGLVTPVGSSMTLDTLDFLKAVGREIGIAIDNAKLLGNTQQREEQAMTLYKLGMNISASLTLSEVLDAVAQAARALLKTDIGLVGLLDETCQEVVIKTAAGIRTNALNDIRMPLSKQSPWSALVVGQPIMAAGDELDWPNLHDATWIKNEQIESLLAVPLQRGERFIGLIEVLARQRRPFLESDAHLLRRLANQVVVSIENAQLYQQLHHLAALEERDRLAREMHDHLAQGLGYLKVKASITDDLLSSGRIDQAQESLQELKKASQFLYTDVREEIFNLRTAVSERMGFFSTLQGYLADYRTHYGVDVHLSIENDDLVNFLPEVGVQLLRIIQEALTNVRRHSDASRVLIQFVGGEDRVCIRIEDNGQGFLPTQVAKAGGQRFGLQIMRERAESVSGSLELDSQPGKGTRVIVRVPKSLAV